MWGSSVVVFEPKLTDLVLEDADSSVSEKMSVPVCPSAVVCVLFRCVEYVPVHCTHKTIGTANFNILS